MSKIVGMSRGGQRHGAWFRHSAKAIALALGVLVGTLLFGGVAAAATGKHPHTTAGSRAASSADVAALSSAEITAMLIAGVLILGAAGAVLWYTAYSRDDPRNTQYTS
jgi:hypothetical protein